MKKNLHVKFADDVQWRNPIIQRALESLYTVEWDSNTPDVVFFGDDGNNHKKYNCIRIYVPLEVNLTNWTKCDYALSFIEGDTKKNLRFPYYTRLTKAETLIKTEEKVKQSLNLKKKFCAFVQSNANQRRTLRRIDFFKKLHAIKHIDSAGKLLNNTEISLPSPLDKIEYYKQFKFVITFENLSWPGYTTEKITDAMEAMSIPIYWGNPNVVKDFNPKSFINVHDFKNDNEVIEHILEIDNDERLFQQYMHAPYFHNNEPNIYYNEERLANFLKAAIETDPIKRPMFCPQPRIHDIRKKIQPYKYLIKRLFK